MNKRKSTTANSEYQRAESGMKPREFAKKYDLSEGVVYRGCKDGSVPCVRIGNRYVILWREFERMAKLVQD